MSTTEKVLPAKAKRPNVPARASATGSDRRILRVWVVGDNAALRGLFVDLLTKQPGIRCRRQFPSAEAVLETLAEERPPDMILLDVNLAGQSGLSAIRPIRKLAPSVKVLMLAMFSNLHYEFEAFRAGASGCLLKSFEFEEIVDLIHEANCNPGAPCLFPNLALHNRAELEAKQSAARKTGLRSRLARACQLLCRAPPRQTVT